MRYGHPSLDALPQSSNLFSPVEIPLISSISFHRKAGSCCLRTLIVFLQSSFHFVTQVQFYMLSLFSTKLFDSQTPCLPLKLHRKGRSWVSAVLSKNCKILESMEGIRIIKFDASAVVARCYQTLEKWNCVNGSLSSMRWTVKPSHWYLWLLGSNLWSKTCSLWLHFLHCLEESVWWASRFQNLHPRAAAATTETRVFAAKYSILHRNADSCPRQSHRS